MHYTQCGISLTFFYWSWKKQEDEKKQDVAKYLENKCLIKKLKTELLGEHLLKSHKSEESRT